jgi:hypothetical protein
VLLQFYHPRWHSRSTPRAPTGSLVPPSATALWTRWHYRPAPRSMTGSRAPLSSTALWIPAPTQSAIASAQHKKVQNEHSNPHPNFGNLELTTRPHVSWYLKINNNNFWINILIPIYIIYKNRSKARATG